MTTFLKAAKSYYGLEDTRGKAELFTNEAGQAVLVVEIVLDDADMVGIVGRMKTLHMEDERVAFVAAPVPSDERMRDEYNAMDRRSKSEFGSFSRYKAWRLVQVEIAPVDGLQGAVEEAVPDEPVRLADSLPAYVYLSPAEATAQQKAMAVGMDEKGNYAVAIEDLTEAQQLRHAAETMQAKHPMPSNATPEEKAKFVELTAVAIDGEIDTAADTLRADYVARTVAAMGRLNEVDDTAHLLASPANAAHLDKSIGQARLSGADGKPTSNADDFGGLPG